MYVHMYKFHIQLFIHQVQFECDFKKKYFIQSRTSPQLLQTGSMVYGTTPTP